MAVHIRKLSKEEMQQWVKAIHRVCEPKWVPALRAAYSHLMPFVDEDCKTAYTDCQYRIGLSPDLLDPSKTTLSQLATTVLHEAMHNTQRHRQRLYEKMGLNGKLCNFAADLEINSLIAQGVHDIALKRAPGSHNGHWERMIGTYEVLDKETAAELNEAKDENGKPLYGRTFKEGDEYYQGLLLPRQGQFYDFEDNLTAEQYLGKLEVDVEDMTITEFMNKLGKDSDKDKSGSSPNDSSNSSNSSSQGASDDSEDGEGQGNSEDGLVTGGGCADSSGAEDGSGNGSASGAQGGGMPSSAGSSGQGTQGGSGSGSNGTYDDGYGGQAIDMGDGHVSVTHIYKRNEDGTRTEVGRDSIVDDLGKHADDEVWKEASRLGIEPISRSEEQRVRDQIAHDIELERKNNNWGNGSANMLLNYIEQGLRPPVVNWKKMLRHIVTRTCQEQTKGRTDYTYRKINRRYSQGDFIFPGMTAYVPKVRVALDTSGSMSATEYYNAFSEMEAILKVVQADVSFVCWDGAAATPIKIKTLKEAQNNLRGGGGTDPSVVIDQIKDEKKANRPDVLIIATDGCFGWDNFAEALEDPCMQNIVPIVLIVYKFDEDLYRNKQKELPSRQKMLRNHHNKAIVLQAWSK